MCPVWISAQTAIISLCRINWLVFITETESVYWRYEVSLYIQFRLIFVFKGLHRCIVEILTAMRTILPWSRSGCHTAPPEGVRSPSFSSTHHNCNSVTDCYHFARLAILRGEGGCVAHVIATTLKVRINCCSHSVSWLLAHRAFEVSRFVLRCCRS